MKIKISLLVMLITVVFGCKTNETMKGFDYGKVDNNVYTNSFFNFKMALPSEWHVQSQEQTEAIAEMGKEIVAGDDKNLKRVLEASEINSAYLLTIFKYEMGTATDSYNPNLMLVAENLKLVPGIKTGGDYLFQTRKLLEQSGINYDYIDEEVKKTIIKNEEFYIMNLAINHMGHTIKQRYYSKIEKGFAVSIIVSFVTEEQKKEVENMINSLQFNS